MGEGRPRDGARDLAVAARLESRQRGAEGNGPAASRRDAPRSARAALAILAIGVRAVAPPATSRQAPRRRTPRAVRDRRPPVRAPRRRGRRRRISRGGTTPARDAIELVDAARPDARAARPASADGVARRMARRPHVDARRLAALTERAFGVRCPSRGSPRGSAAVPRGTTPRTHRARRARRASRCCARTAGTIVYAYADDARASRRASRCAIRAASRSRCASSSTAGTDAASPCALTVARAGEGQPVPARHRPARRRLPHCSSRCSSLIDLADTIELATRDDGAIRAHARCGRRRATTRTSRCAPRTRCAQARGRRARRDDPLSTSAFRSARGLGGGSSDAASVLLALNRLWSLGLSRAELMRIGAALGADVPFFLRRGPRIARGIGEALTPGHAARLLARARDAARARRDRGDIRGAAN